MKTKLLKLIKKDFPNLVWKSVRYISDGLDHDVIVLDNKTIFRFPKKNDSRKMLKDEMELLNFLRQRITTKIPYYLYTAPDSSYGGYQMIVGKGLNVSNYKKLSPQQQKNTTKQIGVFLTELHATPLVKTEKFSIRERSACDELKNLEKETKKIIFELLSASEKKVFDTFFASLSKTLNESYKKVLVHGDLAGNHILLNAKNNVEGVIDFSDRAIHDPAFDFIHFWKLGPDFIEAVWKNYKSKNKAGIVERSKVYAQANAVWNLVYDIKHKSANYRKWYREFKRLVNF